MLEDLPVLALRRGQAGSFGFQNIGHAVKGHGQFDQLTTACRADAVAVVPLRHLLRGLPELFDLVQHEGVAEQPGGDEGQHGHGGDEQKIPHQPLVRSGKNLRLGHAHAQDDILLLLLQQRGDKVDALHSVHPCGLPGGPLVGEDAGQKAFRLGCGLAHGVGVCGIAGQDGPGPVDDGHSRAPGQDQVIQQVGQRPQVQGHAQHGQHRAVLGQYRQGHGQPFLFTAACGLIPADHEGFFPQHFTEQVPVKRGLPPRAITGDGPAVRAA